MSEPFVLDPFGRNVQEEAGNCGRDGEVPQDWVLKLWVDANNMLASSGERHTRLRRLTAKAFTPRRVTDMRSSIEKAVSEMLDTIAEGDAILMCLAAANRDPAVHGADADRFDLARPTRTKHLAFGYGKHFCLGAPLGRLEGAIALPALLDRFPDLRLAVPASELKPLPTFISNGYQALPVHRP